MRKRGIIALSQVWNRFNLTATVNLQLCILLVLKGDEKASDCFQDCNDTICNYFNYFTSNSFRAGIRYWG